MNTNITQIHNLQTEKIGSILRLPKVQSKVSLSKTSIYAGMKNGTFPKAYKLGERAIGWFESDITAWLESRKTSVHKEAA
ncbi:helix-turn-helix transcriptional regulator [Undibacterium sp. Ji67W]|uniref:helix-turn-helix transcriptional regulator n=1 Tax=Undibacterium sp. Ji67W TaxID=3413042 RepID=UPI003BF04ABE